MCDKYSGCRSAGVESYHWSELWHKGFCVCSFGWYEIFCGRFHGWWGRKLWDIFKAYVSDAGRSSLRKCSLADRYGVADCDSRKETEGWRNPSEWIWQMVYRNRGRSSDRYMAGRNDHIGNFDRQLIIGLQSCSSDSDCYLSHMWNLYNGMVFDRISQPGKKNKSRNLMEKQSD